MQIGIVGLGRMGANIARRLMRHGHECVVFDANLDASLALGREGATSSAALQDLVKRLKAPRTVWLMVPAGEPTAKAVAELAGLMAEGDTIIDGGNSFWKDDIARAAALRGKGIHYLDVGTSGGVWGLERGYCLMIGGEKTVVERLDPIFRALAPGAGEIAATPQREGRDPRAGAGLHACRAERRRALRQDDPQRHRIRADAGLCGGLRHPEARGRRRAPGRASARSQSRRHRRGLAARQRHHVLAARSHRGGARRGGRSRRPIRAMSRTQARGAGP